MKVRIISVVCAVVVAACAFTAAFMLPSGKAVFSPTSSGRALSAASVIASQSESSSSSQVSSDTMYIVKAFNDEIGVFLPDGSIPDQIIDVNPQTLPQSEQDRLKAGIEVRSRDELLTLIENYTS